MTSSLSPTKSPQEANLARQLDEMRQLAAKEQYQHKSNLSEMKRDRDDVLQQLVDTTRERDDLLAQVMLLEDRARLTVPEQVTALEKDLARVSKTESAALQQLQQQTQQIQVLNVEIDRLARLAPQLEVARRELDKERATRAALQLDLDKTKSVLPPNLDRMHRVTTEVADLSERLMEAESARTSAESRLATSDGMLKALRTEHLALVDCMSKREAEIQRASQQVITDAKASLHVDKARWEAEVVVHKRDAERKNQENALLKQNVLNLQAETRRLETALRAAGARAEELEKRLAAVPVVEAPNPIPPPPPPPPAIPTPTAASVKELEDKLALAEASCLEARTQHAELTQALGSLQQKMHVAAERERETRAGLEKQIAELTKNKPLELDERIMQAERAAKLAQDKLAAYEKTASVKIAEAERIAAERIAKAEGGGDPKRGLAVMGGVAALGAGIISAVVLGGNKQSKAAASNNSYAQRLKEHQRVTSPPSSPSIPEPQAFRNLSISQPIPYRVNDD